MGAMRRSLLGIAGGIAGTAVVNGVLGALARTGRTGAASTGAPSATAPSATAPSASPAAGVVREALLRYGSGALSGLAYTSVLPRLFGGLVSGSAFGLGAWTLGRDGWLPRLGVVPRAVPVGRRDGLVRTIVTAAAHLVFGAVLGAVAGRRR